MALRHEPANVGARHRSRTSRKEAAFRTHLAVYLCVGAFLFTLNLLTSPFDLWFYWPLFFWGWGLAFHALATYGVDAPARVPVVLRSLVPWLGDASRARPADSQPITAAAPFAAAAFAAVHERIERIKALTWEITDNDVHALARDLCAKAETVVASMARARADAAAVRRFDAQSLAPAVSLLERYVAAARGDQASAEWARRLAHDELPRLLTRPEAASSAAEPSAPRDGPVLPRS